MVSPLQFLPVFHAVYSLKIRGLSSRRVFHSMSFCCYRQCFKTNHKDFLREEESRDAEGGKCSIEPRNSQSPCSVLGDVLGYLCLSLCWQKATNLGQRPCLPFSPHFWKTTSVVFWFRGLSTWGGATWGLCRFHLL